MEAIPPPACHCLVLTLYVAAVFVVSDVYVVASFLAVFLAAAAAVVAFLFASVVPFVISVPVVEAVPAVAPPADPGVFLAVSMGYTVGGVLLSTFVP